MHFNLLCDTNYYMRFNFPFFSTVIKYRTTYIHDDPSAIFVCMNFGTSATTGSQLLISITLVDNQTPEEMRDLLSLVDKPVSLFVTKVPKGVQLAMGVLKNASGREVRVFEPESNVIPERSVALFPGIPFTLTAPSTSPQGLRELFTYISGGPEVYIRIYDKSRQVQREGWVFAFRHAAGRRDDEIALLFSYLHFATPHICNVVVPQGIRITAWALPDEDVPYIFELALSDKVEFIDDRQLQ